MTSGALDALKQWHLKTRGEVVGDALLLVKEKGSEPASTTLTHGPRRFYDRHGFSREFHVQTMRHYAITTMLAERIREQTVAEIAEHASTDFPERTYPPPADREQDVCGGTAVKHIVSVTVLNKSSSAGVICQRCCFCIGNAKSLKYEVYFKLILATCLRRSDVDWRRRPPQIRWRRVHSHSGSKRFCGRAICRTI